MAIFKCPICGAQIEYSGGMKTAVCESCWNTVDLISEEMADRVIKGDRLILNRLIIVANDSVDVKSYNEAVDFALNNFLESVKEYREVLSADTGFKVAVFLIDNFGSLAKTYYYHYKKQIAKNQGALMKLFDASMNNDGMMGNSIADSRRSNYEAEIRKAERDRINIIPDFTKVITKLCDCVPNQLKLYRSYILDLIQDEAFSMVREKLTFRMGPDF